MAQNSSKKSTQSKKGRTSAILAQLNDQDLKLIKVAIHRHTIPDLPDPVPLIRTIENPADLVLHRTGEGQRPIFDRDDIVVNQECLEERVILHSPGHSHQDDRRRHSKKDSHRGHSQESNSSRSSSRSRSRSYSPEKRDREYDSTKDRHKSRSKESQSPDSEPVKKVCVHSQIRTDLQESPSFSITGLFKDSSYKSKETHAAGKSQKSQDFPEKDDPKAEGAEKYKDNKKDGPRRGEGLLEKEKYRARSKSPKERASTSYESERDRYYRDKERRLHEDKPRAERDREWRRSPPGIHARRNRLPYDKRRSRSPLKKRSKSPSYYSRRHSKSPESRKRSRSPRDARDRYHRYSRSPSRRDDSARRKYSRSPERRREERGQDRKTPPPYKRLPEDRSPHRHPPSEGKYLHGRHLPAERNKSPNKDDDRGHSSRYIRHRSKSPLKYQHKRREEGRKQFSSMNPEEEYKKYPVPDFKYMEGQVWFPLNPQPFIRQSLSLYPRFRPPILDPRAFPPFGPPIAPPPSFYKPRIYNRQYRPRLPLNAITAPSTTSTVTTASTSSSTRTSTTSQPVPTEKENLSENETQPTTTMESLSIVTTSIVNVSFSETTPTDSKMSTAEASLHSDNADSTVSTEHSSKDPNKSPYLVNEPEDDNGSVNDQ